MPATRTWLGGTFFWDVPTNWAGGNVAQAGDDVVIDLAGANHWFPQVDSDESKSIRSISVNGNNPNNDPARNVNFASQKKLDVQGTLEITGGAVSDWTKGNMLIGQTGILDIKGEFLLKSGEILSPNGNGNINVYQDDLLQIGAKLTIQDRASVLGAQLNVGFGGIFGGMEGNGIVEVGLMFNNLTIRDNADITVGTFGTLQFTDVLAAGQSGTTGGIVRGVASDNSEIIVHGMASRTSANANWVQVQIPMTIETTGFFVVESGSAIKFDAAHKPYDIVSSGSIELARETHLLAVNGGVRMLGGNLTLKSDPLLPNPPAFIHLEGDLLVESGLVTVGDIPGRYVTFLTNNLTLKGDAIVLV